MRIFHTVPISIRGSVLIPAPRVQVWEMLFDAEILKRILNRVPGVSVGRFERVTESEYVGSAWVSVAMIKGQYEIRTQVITARPRDSIRLHAEGNGGGNRASGEISLSLLDQGGQTALNYEAQGNVSGPLANLGQRLVDSVGRQFIDQGAQALAAEFVRPSAPPDVQPPLPAPATSRQVNSRWLVFWLLAVFVFAAGIYLLWPK